MPAADIHDKERVGMHLLKASQLSKSSQTSRMGVGLVLSLIVLFLSVYKLESAPPFWWDEGWTLSVARNWVEHGHYGNLRNGEPVPPGLSGAWPIVAPIALSFQLFGVGLWQGRLVGVIFTLGALVLLYLLSQRLYNRAIGLTTLFVVSFMTIHPALHAVLTGRQVLGEMPVLFYLLLGYVCLLAGLQGSLRRAWWGLGGAALAWGIALNTKLQAVPFWMVSLLGPLVLMAWQRQWAVVGRLGAGLLATLLIAQGLAWGGRIYLNPGEVISGLYNVTAFVPVAQVRLMAIQVVCVFGFPTLLGLLYATRSLFQERYSGKPEEIVRLALYCLCGSWLEWYVLLANWFPRYLFPAVFIGSMFVAVMVYELLGQFRWAALFRHIRAQLAVRKFDRQATGAIFACLVVGVATLQTVPMLSRSYSLEADTSVLRVARFLNTQTPVNAIVETYDSPLFFLLNRPYHYPPDEIHVDLIRRLFLGQAVQISYNPLIADPDYLVVNRPFLMWWTLYDPVVKTGAFRPIQNYGRYTIYERVRLDTEENEQRRLLTSTSSKMR